jgi:hypothetical protein
MQVLFVLSGCDFVSFVQTYSKLIFIKTYLNNIHFVGVRESMRKSRRGGRNKRERRSMMAAVLTSKYI